jgi:hypothetical protein
MLRAVRRIVAVLALTAMFALSVGTLPALADQKHHCAPGQQGNPHPGFKPGNC